MWQYNKPRFRLLNQYNTMFDYCDMTICLFGAAILDLCKLGIFPVYENLRAFSILIWGHPANALLENMVLLQF